MDNLEILYFEQLKKEVQTKYLENHTPSHSDITKWKGIDIIYFQEDLRKYAKGNISEKSFYTYFKTSPVTKLPRIDMLNLLSNYAGYESWFNYKKLKPIEQAVPETSTIVETTEEIPQTIVTEPNNEVNNNIETNTPKNEILEVRQPIKVTIENELEKISKEGDLQINTTDNQTTKQISNLPKKNFFKKNIWYIITSVLCLLILFLVFRDQWMYKDYTYSFIDSDRNTIIKDELDVKILKENESPILIRVKPNEPFKYTTKSKSLTMIVSSPFYRTDTIKRNLETAPEKENIELKPNDYAILLYYYSRSIKDFKKKREQLNQLISDDAQITQVYDNETYGVERLDKQKYISLVTLPTTALENLNVIDTQMKNGKIVLIRFKISTNEN
ncbi:hypothetical protein [Soonwooa sp.]|uniref:hypothetical protein n=1 Tax=Soonwooa sp. TaxID=1938592 RepID=UPI00261A0011|nr:hypothetical protein [Soonwooa sp.]